MVYERLHQIINEEVIISLDMEKRNVTVKENDPGASLKKVVLEGFTNEDKFMAFKLGSPKLRMSQYLNQSQEKINKGCDAVIATEINGNSYIFFCELKSDSPKPKKYEDQFLSSHAFVDYIDSLIKKFYKLSLGKFKKIYVLFTSKKKLPKTPVYPGARKRPSARINNIPLFIEGNCKKGYNPDCINIKKYAI
ncbi:MAG: hypothetical protein PVH61_32150 [Candidatus Aminicenantes bacterium]|jgi:hypothetical protein